LVNETRTLAICFNRIDQLKEIRQLKQMKLYSLLEYTYKQALLFFQYIAIETFLLRDTRSIQFTLNRKSYEHTLLKDYSEQLITNVT
jgi:hypothetical protein